MSISFKPVDFPRKGGYARTINISFKNLIQFVLDNHEDNDNSMAKFAKVFKSINYITGSEKIDVLFKWVSKYINANLLVDFQELDNNVIEIAHGDFVRVGNSKDRNDQKGIVYFEYDIDLLEIVVRNLSYDIYDDDGNIPKDFESIVKDIPLDYWVDGDFDYLVWVNLNEYREQCLANITQLDTNFFKTTFNANNKEYNIVYPGNNKDKFIKILLMEDVNMFYRYYYDVEDESDDTVTLEGGFKFDLNTTLFTHTNPID